MRPPFNLAGARFGHLTVLGRDASDKHGTVRWRCKCDCGTVASKRGADLKAGKVTSCGCRMGLRTHGLTRSNGRRTKLYAVWIAMRRRCSSKRDAQYHRYGGRGIRVCREWASSFAAFHTWAHQSGYRVGLTLDRIDNDGPYSPANCRWADRKVQTRNRSVTATLTHRGVTRPLVEWAERLGMHRDTLRGRIRAGWSPERALTTPVGKVRHDPR